jgi:hypothetical protein
MSVWYLTPLIVLFYINTYSFARQQLSIRGKIMAIGRITGQMLSANLARSGTDLTFETNLLALDVTNSRVGVGTASPAVTLHVAATDALRLPSGTGAERPGTPANGDLRYNSDDATIEGFSNGAWANLASGTELKDADEDTTVNVEPSSDLDEIHFGIAGTKRAKISASTIELGVTGISTTASTISALTTNGDITLSPNGTGEVNISKVDIDSGAIDGTTIGANSAADATINTLTVNNNATITGDLTVNGTTTTIDSTTLTIEDPLIQLAKNNSGGDANTFDQGLFFNRGGLDNVSFLWDESADRFVFAITSGEDGTTAGNVTIDSFAPVTTGGLDVQGNITMSGLLFADSIQSPGSNANITLTAQGSGSVVVTSPFSINQDGTNFDIGAGADLQIQHDGTNSLITNTTGDLAITTAAGSEVVINEAGANVDFRIEGDTDTDLFVTDASADQIGISTAAGSISYVLDASGSTDAFRLPQGDTATRPTAATGIIRFNSETGKYEGSTDGSTFVDFAIAGAAPTFTKETATGDGSTTTFTGFFSSSPESANNVFVYIDNVYQEPTENYSVSGTNITFTSAPHSGARIFAITGADGTSLVTGGVARSETIAVSVSGSSAVTIMSFNAATYRSAEIFIQVQDSGNTEFSAMKGVVVHDGTTAYTTIFGITNTGANDLSTFTATHDGSNTVNVQATPNNSGTQSIKVQYSLVSA